MIYIIHDSVKDKFPETRPETLVDHQTQEWWAGMEQVREMKPWYLDNGKNHKVENGELSRDMEVDHFVYELSDLGYVLDKIEIDVAIVNTCLTFNGEKVKMIMSAENYSEGY
jgi:hypothetical protein